METYTCGALLIAGMYKLRIIKMAHIVYKQKSQLRS